MIGYFPSIYPDELLYSWFARYHDHSGNISPKRTMYELFNSTKIVATLDIPSNLNQVYNTLSHFNIPEVDSIVKNHTFFNYYTFFQPESNRKKVLDYILVGGKPGSSHLLLGINATKVNEWKFLRFCPTCYQEDIDKYGEPYWHLSHQLPKSFYCTKHNELLIDSQVEVRNKQKHQYKSALYNIDPKLTINNFYTTKTVQYLEIIAKENSKLLEQDYVNVDDVIHSIYKYLLQINGYANYFGNIDQQKLAEQFIKFYGKELLELVDSNVNIYDESCWLKAITRKHKKVFHPIRHILLLKFFGVDIENINHLIGKKYYPFGEAPYYCLNPAANHYKERVINEVTISLCTETRKPVGTFKCECGFTYSRRGPDKNEEDALRIGRIKEFGDVWHESLMKLLKEEGLSHYQVAKTLNCDIGTVKKYATSPLSKNNHCIKDISGVKGIREREWLELINNNPSLSITSIRKLNPALYAWHYRNNKQWLKDNSLIKEKLKKQNTRVDWESRDVETLNQVKEIIRNLYLIGKPVYVNKTQVSKRIDSPSFLEKHLNKLPKTKEFLANNLETRTEFQIRRLLWSYKQLKVRGEEIKTWKIRRLAGFRKPMDKKIEVILKNIDEWGCNL